MHYQSAIDFTEVLIADFEMTSVLHDLRTDVVQVLPTSLMTFLRAHQNAAFDEHALLAVLKPVLGSASQLADLLAELVRQNIIKPCHEN